MTEDQRDRLINYVRENIIRNTPRKVDRANGEVLQKGVRVYLSVETKEKRNLDAVNWEGPFTIYERRGDTVELEERRLLTYHISRLKVANKR